MKSREKLIYFGIGILLLSYGTFFAFVIDKADEIRNNKSRELLSQSQKEQDSNAKFTLIQEAAFLNPNEETFLKAGIMAEDLGYGDLANGYLKRVKTANGFFQLGNIYFSEGQYDKALSLYKKAITKENKAEYYLAKVKSDLALARIDDAKADSKYSLGIQTGEEARFYKYLIAYINDENPPVPELTGNLKEITDRLIAYKSPSNRVNVVFDVLNTLNYPQLAIQYLQSQAQVGLVDRDGYLALTKHYLSINDIQTAYEMLLKAKQKDAFYPQTYQQLANVATKLGKTDEASQYLAYYNKLSW